MQIHGVNYKVSFHVVLLLHVAVLIKAFRKQFLKPDPRPGRGIPCLLARAPPKVHNSTGFRGLKTCLGEVTTLIEKLSIYFSIYILHDQEVSD